MEKENRKRRSIVNLFDITVIVVVFVLGIAVFLGNRVNPSPQEEVGTGEIAVLKPRGVTVEYTLELNEVEEQVADLFKEGDPLIDLEKKYSLGTIKSIEVSPTKIFVNDYENGRIVQAEEPDRYTVLLHLTSEGVADGRNITVDGGYVLKIGKTVIGKVPGGMFTALVVALERV